MLLLRYLLCPLKPAVITTTLHFHCKQHKSTNMYPLKQHAVPACIIAIPVNVFYENTEGVTADTLEFLLAQNPHKFVSRTSSQLACCVKLEAQKENMFV